MNPRVVLACALAIGALASGCQTVVPGRPVAQRVSPTEPSFPTTRPRPTAPVPGTLNPTPSNASPAPGGEELEPQNGYVFIQTKSGQTRCQLSEEEVGCEAQFVNSPTIDGQPANGVRLSPDGEVSWVLGNLGDIPAVTLDYRTYSAVGWTIDAAPDGTRFTNDSTGHGMVIAVEGVQTF